MGDKQLVMAFFENEAAADGAVSAVQAWDKATKEIKLGAIGVLVKDDKGKIKTHKLGARKTGTGVILGVLAGILSGGITLLGGAVAGGIFGSFFRKGLGLSKEDLARVDGDLNGGKAAVCVVAEPDEAAAVAAKLAELGGMLEAYEVTEAAVAEAAQAVEAAPEKETPAESAAIEEAPVAEAATEEGSLVAEVVTDEEASVADVMTAPAPEEPTDKPAA